MTNLQSEDFNTTNMMNETGSNCTEVGEWLANTNLIFSGISFMMSTAIVFPLLYHAYVVKFRRNAGIHKHRGFREIKNYSEILSLLSILAALFICLRSLLDLILYGWVIWYNIDAYSAVTTVELILNIMTLYCIYTVLWLRMWIFYNHSAMERFKSKFTISICWILFAVMLITSAGNAVFFIMDRRVKMVKVACLTREPLRWGDVKFYFLGSCTVFYQVTLLALFIFPLIKHKNIRTKGGKANKSFIRVLKRVFGVMAMCCATDLITVPISIKWDSTIVDVSFLLYNINILVNYLCLLYSFGDCSLRVFSFCLIARHSSQGIVYTSSSDNHSHKRKSSLMTGLHVNGRKKSKDLTGIVIKK